MVVAEDELGEVVVEGKQAVAGTGAVGLGLLLPGWLIFVLVVIQESRRAEQLAVKGGRRTRRAGQARTRRA